MKEQLPAASICITDERGAEETKLKPAADTTSLAVTVGAWGSRGPGRQQRQPTPPPKISRERSPKLSRSPCLPPAARGRSGDRGEGMSQKWGGGGGSAHEKYPERQPDSRGLKCGRDELSEGRR